ncbi:NHR domain-containing protein [Aphelenchoides fujianensis]|nr:NHR domain-containing protein [Aphelenchoides fujianensis]
MGFTTFDPAATPNLDSAEFNDQTFLLPLPRKPNSSAAFPIETNAIFGVYFRQLADGLFDAFALINDEHVRFREEPIQLPPGRPLFAVVDLFGNTKSVEIIPVKRTVPRLFVLCERQIGRFFRGVATLPLPRAVRRNIDLRSALNSVAVV